ncbi:MAG TPA: AAA family ATPase [Polyangiaceae bacterium]|nr:AAA family ATPase [Polyangiaceae bacterium]
MILTSHADEYEAVRQHLHNLDEEVSPVGAVYERGVFTGEVAAWDIILVETGVGSTDSTLQAQLAIDYFQPAVVLLVGAAVGFKSTQIGDVVAASKAYEYAHEGGGDFNALPSVSSSYALEQRARAEARKSQWRPPTAGAGVAPDAPAEGSPNPAAKSAPAAAGPRAWVQPIVAVQWAALTIRDELDLYAKLQTACPDAAAIDQTAYGLLNVIQTRRPVDALLIRGIGRIVGEIDRNWQVAAQNAAAFAMQVLSRFTPPRTALELAGSPAASAVRDRFFLRRAAARHVRSLRSIVWEIAPEQATGWHVLIGNNGAGKSSMLRALALALMAEDDARALRQDFRTWLRKDCDQGEVAVTVERLGLSAANGNGQGEREAADVRLAFARGPEEAGLEPGARPVRLEREGDVPHVFCAGYGPFRRFTGGDPDLVRELAPYPQALRHISLFSERAALPEGLAWLKELDHRRHEKHPDGELLDALTEFINQPGFLPHGTRLSAISSKAVIFTDGNGYAIDVEELSDGFRSVLSLTLDLLRQLAATVGARGVFVPRDPTRVIASGIVLIDEIDAHLHPTWQREVGVWFHRHFPNIQFIVTSHSPLVCQAAEHGTVFLLPRPGTDDEGRMLAGIELDRVRFGTVLDAYGTGVFGQGVTRSETSKQMLHRLTELNQKELDDGLSPEEQAEQERLRRVLPTGGSAGVRGP